MKVTEDKFTMGIVADGGPLSSAINFGMADKIHSGIGTEYEQQTYTHEEIHAACIVLGKPFDHANSRCRCVWCRREQKIISNIRPSFTESMTVVIVMLLAAGAMQIIGISGVPMPWWQLAVLYMTNVFIGFIAACILGNLP